jgi:putative transposase
MRRKVPLVTGEVYHIFSKSIADFKIFNSIDDCQRMLDGIRFFRSRRPGQALSWLLRNDPTRIEEEDVDRLTPRRVQLIAYCIMQTHFHLLLRQKEDDGISVFMGELLNSYARYFNLRHKRKGPLWEGVFKGVHIESDEHALHETRYIHLNPVTAYLVDSPADWKFSSYAEYVGGTGPEHSICEREHFPKLPVSQYVKFVEDRIDHQRMLAKYKHLILENPSAP